MARSLNLDTTKQEFLKESYRNEAKFRNTWFQTYFGSNQLPENLRSEDPAASPVPATKVAKPTLINIKPAPATPPQARSPTYIEPTPVEKLDGSSKVPEMRGASPTTKQMIYTGLSSEGDGRKAYLIKRKDVNPEKKFEYPLTSSLEVGWDIHNVAKTMEVLPRYGKSRIVRDTFFAENGVM